MAIARAATAPRIRFETVSPEAAEALPRMDVAAFVGFAASGPMHVPVAVEDAKQFRSIFGDDLTLAWDAETGETVRAQLGPAVRSFFGNGGRRCWVIRVAAGTATHNYFPVPGLLKCRLDDKGNVVAREPAFARARSEGSWSDALRVSAALRARVLPKLGYDAATSVITIPLGAGLGRSGLPGPGDLVRLTFGDSGATRYWLYARAVPLPADTTVAPCARYRLAEPAWFADEPAPGLATGALDAVVECFDAAAAGRSRYYFDAEDSYAEPAAVITADSMHAQLTALGAGKARMHVDPGARCVSRIAPGILLRVGVAGQTGWFAVTSARIELDRGTETSPPATGKETLVVDGERYWPFDMSAAPFDPGVPVAQEILSLDLESRVSDGPVLRLDDIGLTADHPRYWSSLPGDQGRYRPRPRIAESRLAAEARDITFPLASADPRPADARYLFIPLGVSRDQGEALAASPQSLPPLYRDGLANYDASLFLDPDLADSATRRLIDEADELRYLSVRPRPLCGLHAALGFGVSRIQDEITLISVPDAIHRGWEPRAGDASSVSSVPATGTPPDDQVSEAAEFAACFAPSLDSPVLKAPAVSDATSRITLEWSGAPDLDHILEESLSGSFDDATEIYAGRGRRIELNRPAGGRHGFRVRASQNGLVSPWSNTLIVTLAPAIAYVARPVDGYAPQETGRVHVALLRLCAAQGELFAVLGAPGHFRAPEMREHVLRLAGAFANERMPSPLSYGALYHPWVQCRDETSGIIAQPPDGAVLGVFAARASERGAWVAPANQRLDAVLALTLPVEPVDDLPANVVTNTPRGFLCLRADTLDTDDPDQRLISVRRLLILLRRLVLRHGVTYAFEPNGEALRRLVQRRFEALLRGLHDRGAFAGGAPDQSYRVDAGAGVNRATSTEQGRLIVELRVRPSLPMEFITVRLVQQGGRLTVAEGR